MVWLDFILAGRCGERLYDKPVIIIPRTIIANADVIRARLTRRYRARRRGVAVSEKPN